VFFFLKEKALDCFMIMYTLDQKSSPFLSHINLEYIMYREIDICTPHIHLLDKVHLRRQPPLKRAQSELQERQHFLLGEIRDGLRV